VWSWQSWVAPAEAEQEGSTPGRPFAAAVVLKREQCLQAQAQDADAEDVSWMWQHGLLQAPHLASGIRYEHMFWLHVTAGCHPSAVELRLHVILAS